MKAHRITHTICVLACLWVGYGCSMMKVVGSTVAGAVAGSPLGPLGIAGGAALGAGGGHMWTQNDELQQRLDKAEAAARAARDDRDQLTLRIADLDKRVSGIVGAPPADPKLPPLLYGPPMPKPSGSWLHQTPFEWLKDKIGGGN